MAVLPRWSGWDTSRGCCLRVGVHLTPVPESPLGTALTPVSAPWRPDDVRTPGSFHTRSQRRPEPPPCGGSTAFSRWLSPFELACLPFSHGLSRNFRSSRNLFLVKLREPQNAMGGGREVKRDGRSGRYLQARRGSGQCLWLGPHVRWHDCSAWAL